MRTAKKQFIFMAIKYASAIMLTILAFSSMHMKKYFVGSLLELGIIFILSNILITKHRRTAYILNSILIFLYNVQQIVLTFGMSYVSFIMVDNLGSLEDLQGRAFEYIAFAVIGTAISFLPITEVALIRLGQQVYLSAFLLMAWGFTLIYGNAYSPMYGYVSLGMQELQHAQQNRFIENQENMTSEFYQSDIGSSVQKPAELPDHPNVILIFTEGLSQGVIEDSRNLTPTIAAYEDNSLNFDNYYNHTAATYRGLIGQLYSGYQLDNYDSNTLISLQEILKEWGYDTTFINVEPNNYKFTKYLNSFQFDHLLMPETDNMLSDKEAYALLWDTVQGKEQENKPFFTAMYTVGTHVSFDSPDEIFGDGSDAELNKFHNLDAQFNTFMDKFNESTLAENTVVIFTTDHATFVDDAFRTAFPDYQRSDGFLDRIPLFIYYKGIPSEHIDVRGRNSLCLAPTILDYLDISAPNYFLGQVNC